MAGGCLRYFCFVVVFCSCIILCSGRLYSTKDPLVLLENDTIAETIYDSPVSWIVEFYSSWCGHCHAFAPTWRKMADVVKDWRPVILVAVLDCAEERNLETCRKFEIEAYPTIKFFNARSKKEDLGTKLEGDKMLIHLLHSIVKHVEKQTDLAHRLPDFKPISNEDSIIDLLEKDRRSRSKQLVLVFEKSTSFIGKELTLDMMKYPGILVRRVLDDQTSLARKYRVTEFPSLILVHKDETFRELSRSNRTHIGFKKALQSLELYHKQLKWPHKAEIANELYSKRYETRHRRENHQERSSDVYMADLESTLLFTFTREIPMKKEISGSRLSALANFIHLLYECFPGSAKIRRFLLDTGTKFLKQHKKHGPIVRSMKVFTSEEFIEWVINHRRPGKAQLQGEIKWKGCLGSKSKYRGYPCGLWTLFHTITVTCSKVKPHDLTGIKVITYIREYIRHFFSCTICSKHFTEMAANVEDDVVTFRDAVLWLWHGHNIVNRRLHGDESEDPKFPKIQYPPKDLCRECHTDEGGWNEEVLYRFLQGHYGPDNIRVQTNEVADVLTGFEDADRVRASSSSLSSSVASLIGLNRYDTSLCLLVYSIITLGFIALYVYFIRRRKFYRNGFGYGYKHHVHTP